VKRSEFEVLELCALARVRAATALKFLREGATPTEVKAVLFRGAAVRDAEQREGEAVH
jgi:hypothetical protein